MSQAEDGLRFLLITTLVLIHCGLAHARDDASQAAEVRKAVEKSLPFLEEKGLVWMKQKQCASCHVVSFMLWSHNEARARGIGVDEKKLAEWNEWTRDFSMTRRAFFKFTADSLSKPQPDAVPDEVLAKLNPMVDKPFQTRQELRDAMAKVLSGDELE